MEENVRWNMKTKKSIQACVAIGLLIAQMAISAIIMLANYPAAYFFSFLFECIPTTGAVVLVFYDHKYTAPIVGKFTLLRVWSLVLIWVQPALALLSYGTAGMLSSYILGTWIGSCVFIVISTVLLVLDGKAFVQSRNREENPSYEANQLEKIDHFSAMEGTQIEHPNSLDDKFTKKQTIVFFSVIGIFILSVVLCLIFLV